MAHVCQRVPNFLHKSVKFTNGIGSDEILKIAENPHNTYFLTTLAEGLFYKNIYILEFYTFISCYYANNLHNYVL